MIQAILRGKFTRQEEGMEDLLTSNCFGMLGYVAHDIALVPFLSLARDHATGRQLDELLCGVTRVERVDYWPMLSYPDRVPCEPDVVLVLADANETRTVLLIEAKFGSKKSSRPTPRDARPTDQLAKEYDNLRELARLEGADTYALVYLTADFGWPRQEIEESTGEYREKRREPMSVYWLSWRMLPGVLSVGRAAESAMLRDLRYLLSHLNLTPYTGLAYDLLRAPSWSFTGGGSPTYGTGGFFEIDLKGVRVPSWSFEGTDARAAVAAEAGEVPGKRVAETFARSHPRHARPPGLTLELQRWTVPPLRWSFGLAGYG
jgi:hypothetical protein